MALLLSVLLILSALPMAVLADDDTAANAAELAAAAADADVKSVKLTADIELTEPLHITGEFTIDLNGKKLTARFDPDKVSEPLATVIAEKKAALKLKGGKGSTLAPPVLTGDGEHVDDLKCFGIFAQKNSAVSIGGDVQIKTGDKTSYMVFLAGDNTLRLTDHAGISGGAYGIRADDGAELKEFTVSAEGSVASGSAISQISLPFSRIIPETMTVTADGTEVTDLSAAPSGNVKVYAFGPRPEPTVEPTTEPTAEPTAEPTEEPAVPDAPGGLAWSGTSAAWQSVDSVTQYALQLYLNGTGDENKVGESITVDGTSCDLASYMTVDGTYRFTVASLYDAGNSQPSAPSGEYVRDTAAPTVTVGSGVRNDASTAAFSFTPSESGSYYYTVAAADAAAPDAAELIGSKDTMHGECTAAEQTVTVSGIADDAARTVYLAVVDKAGNASGLYSVGIPAYEAPKPTPPAVPGYLNWSGTTATWQPVSGASGYSLQLYLNGTGEDNKVGEAITVTGTVYDLASMMTQDGTYRFTVTALSDAGNSDPSAPSGTYTRDTAAPAVTAGDGDRKDSSTATFRFTSGESGDYYYIVAGSDSTAPAADEVRNSAEAVHGRCSTSQQTVTVSGIADNAARTVYLVVVDRAGNASETCAVAIPAYEPVQPTAPPAPGGLAWSGLSAVWQSVPGVKEYSLQLYKDGTDDAHKLGEAITVEGTIYDLSALITQDGTYRFTVAALSDAGSSDPSSFSAAWTRDTTPPRITSRAPVRNDASRATIYFTSSESGEYYLIIVAENSPTPKVEDVTGSADAIHGACITTEQAIGLNRIADAGAKTVFLVVVDKAGNASNPYKLAIPAYATPQPSASASPSPSPSPTPTPKPEAYNVTLPSGTGFTVTIAGTSSTRVKPGGKFSFIVNISNGYTRGSGFSVKANGTTLKASNGVYTISNINADQTITVSGVVAVQVTAAPYIPAAPSITTTLLSSATMGKPFSQQLTATGGTPITWSYTGSLPNGVSLSADGLLSGTPTVEGSYRFTVKASNSTGSANRQMTLVVTAAEYTVTEGANAVWAKGSEEGLTFRGSGQSDFTIRIDGALVPADKVSWSEDRMAVTVSHEYLETLAAGSHTVTLVYTDGNAKAKFTVKAENRNLPPTVTAQPQSVEAVAGSSATFTVTSSGSGITLQWQVDKNDGAGWTDIPGAVRASYTVARVTSAQDGWKYRCVIKNAAGTAESNEATLTLKEGADGDADTEQPDNTEKKTRKTGRIILGALLTLAVAGAGTGAYFFFRRRSEFDDYADDDE